MQWDDFSFFGGDSGDFSGSDLGSFSPSDYSGFDLSGGLTPQTTPDPSLGGGGGLDTSGIYGGMNQGAGGFSPQLNAGLGAPGAAAPGVIPGLGGLGGLNSLQGLLGLGGAGAGLLGALMGGGVTGTQKPVIGTAQKAAINQAPQGLTPFAQGTSPLQMQQQQLLTALASGQIPPQMANLVANAYQPQYQQAAQRSIDAARQAGFYDNPLSSPVGGAIMGPAAAQLQGQQANSLLGLMQTMPGLYNTPIQQQASAAGQQGQQLLSGANMGIGQQNSVPLGSQIGQGIGNALQGASQSIGQANQQNFQNQLLQQMVQGRTGVNNFYQQ